MSMTPEEAARRYKQLRAILREWARRTLAQWSTRVGATATSRYMRDAKGEPRRRSDTDAGPLRIVSGRLARSLVHARYRGRQEGIRRVSVSGTRRITLTTGSRVPYAGVHERGRPEQGIPARPYLAPAIREAMPTLRTMARRSLAEAINEGLSKET